MAKFVNSVSITPAKRIARVNSVNSVNSFCRVCNINLSISGYGKLNLFDGAASKEQTIAAKLSSVLGFPVIKEVTASSILCMKCRREVEKFDKLIEGLEVFREKAKKTLNEQKELTERGEHFVERVKRCHKSSPTSSSPARKKSTVNSDQSAPPRSLLRQSQKENVLPAELQIHNDLVVPGKPRKITSSIEV